MQHDIADMTNKMREYFRYCTKQARGEVLDEKGKTIMKYKREIASLAGLCVRLEIGKAELMSMQSGSDAERKFFDDMLLEYEVCACAMRAASMIDDKALAELQNGLFAKSGTAGNDSITVVFPNWNAPDDWEDYQALRNVLEENGLTWKQGVAIIKKAFRDDEECSSV